MMRRLLTFANKIVPAESRFRRAATHPAVTARIGLWLGVAFTVCFATGLISHAIQHPPSWFFWPSRPVNLYRVTQGLHVISGISAIPLLLAKLWSVFPKLFARPIFHSIPHAIERGSILLLSGAGIFELVTGLFNIAQVYPWKFFFPTAHYAVAWIAFGSIAVHVGIKLPVIRDALTKPVPEPGDERKSLSRKQFLRIAWLATGVAVLTTAGSTVGGLNGISALSERSTNPPDGLPVNRTALAAGVRKSATDPSWRLEIVSPAGNRQFSLAELSAMRQVDAELPIACVEGWSASATWSGVPIADLLRLVNAEPGASVRVESLERNGNYRSSTLPGEHTKDPLTLLALRCNGNPLSLDHGFPCRVIAPNRPGVLQTKWVHRLEVLG